MKLFYDTDGNVVGSVEGPMEGSFGIPSNAIAAIVPDQELIDRFNDPLDDLHPHGCTVEDATLLLPPDADSTQSRTEISTQQQLPPESSS